MGPKNISEANFLFCIRDYKNPLIIKEITPHNAYLYDIPIAEIENSIYNDDLFFVKKNVENAISTNSCYEVSYRIMCRDGKLRPVTEKGRIIFNHDGKTQISAVLFEDDSTKKGYEKYHKIFDTISEAVLLYKNNIIEDVNEALCKMFDWKKEDLIGKDTREMFKSDFIDPKLSKVLKNLNIDLSYSYEETIWHQKKDGSIIYISIKSEQINVNGENFRCVRCSDISNDYLSKQKLRETNEKYRSLILQSREGIVIHDKGIAIEASPRFCEIVGKSEDEVIGKPVLNHVIPEEVPKILAFLSENETNVNNVRNAKAKILHKSGKVIDIELHAHKIEIKNKPYRYVIIRDISEEIAYQKIIEANEKKYKRLSEITSEIIIVHDNGIIKEVNKSACEFYGLSENKLIGMHTFDLIPNELIQKHNLTKEGLEMAYKTNRTERGFYTHYKNDKPIFCQFYEHIFYVDGKKLRYNILRDITELHLAQIGLEESRNKYKIFADITNEAISIHKNGIVKEANKVFLDMFQLSKEEIYGFNGLNLVLANDRDITKKVLALTTGILNSIQLNDFENFELLRQHIFQEIESELERKSIIYPYQKNEQNKSILPLIKKDGTIFFAESYEDIIVINGELYQFQIFRDVTDTLKFQKKLEESNKKYKFFADATREAIIIHKDGEILEVNSTACKLFNKTERELTASNLKELAFNSGAAFQLQSIENESSSKLERVLFSKNDDETFIAEIWESRFQMDGENLKYTVIRDITERIQYEQRIEELLLNYSEKNKQLNCLLELAQLSNSKNHISYNEMMQNSLKILTTALQYHEISSAEVNYRNKSWQTKNFNSNSHSISAPIVYASENIGSVKLAYTEECPEAEIGPFLNSEKLFVEALGVQLGLLIEKKLNEDRVLASVLETEERERARMAKELHDSLGQILMAVSLNLEYLKKEINTLSDKNQIKLSNALEYLAMAMDESRQIAHTLMPKTIGDFGYVLAVQSLLERLGSDSIKFNFYHNLEESRLNAKMELALFRITQEAINNILKHSHADSVTIQLMKYYDVVILTIEDNGIGFIISDIKNSFGLNSMQNRTNALSGIFTLESQPGHGSTIMVEIPL